MKVLRIIIIIVFTASIIAGCGQTDKQELEQQTPSPTTVPNPTRVPIPDVPHDEGFAYKDQFLGFITIIEGEGWDVETHYDHRQVVFYNEYVNEHGINAIYVLSTLHYGQEEHQMDKAWNEFFEDYNPKNVTVKDIEVGNELTETPMKGVEYSFEGTKSGEDVKMDVIIVAGESLIYVISNQYNEEGEEVNMKVYETIKKTFIQCETFF